jgi:hypothetical protein
VTRLYSTIFFSFVLCTSPVWKSFYMTFNKNSRWVRYQNGAEFVGDLNDFKRKKKTDFTPNVTFILAILPTARLHLFIFSVRPPPPPFWKSVDTLLMTFSKKSRSESSEFVADLNDFKTKKENRFYIQLHFHSGILANCSFAFIGDNWLQTLQCKLIKIISCKR